MRGMLYRDYSSDEPLSIENAHEAYREHLDKGMIRRLGPILGGPIRSVEVVKLRCFVDFDLIGDDTRGTESLGQLLRPDRCWNFLFLPGDDRG
jgi:hypothetical protein